MSTRATYPTTTVRLFMTLLAGERQFYRDQAEHSLLDSDDPLNLDTKDKIIHFLVVIHKRDSPECLVYYLKSCEGDIQISHV